MNDLARILALFEPQFLKVYDEYADVKPNRQLSEPYVEWSWPEGSDPTEKELQYRYLGYASKCLALVARQGAVDPTTRRLVTTLETAENNGRRLRITMLKPEGVTE